MENIYQNRRKNVYSYMKQNKIAAAVFIDSEDKRESALRYLTGHPTDAVLVLFATEDCVLIPWDENLASKYADADKIIPYTKFNCKSIAAVKSVLSEKGIESGSSVCIPPSTTYIQAQKFIEELKDFNIICKDESVHDYVVSLREVKDSYEIEQARKSCNITKEITASIIKMLKNGEIKTEMDVALFIEKQLRLLNAEKTSFDTLAAGNGRSYAIHAFPGYTQNSWGQSGLSILDYGVCFNGYASDCTITIARNPDKEQEKLLQSVQTAFNECLPLYKNGLPVRGAASKADEVFARTNRSMPHGLGHGIGLEIHEAPFVSKKSGEDKLFKAGNIVTLEPGLYDINLGGTRLENDVLITENGNEILTTSQIFYL